MPRCARASESCSLTVTTLRVIKSATVSGIPSIMYTRLMRSALAFKLVERAAVEQPEPARLAALHLDDGGALDPLRPALAGIRPSRPSRWRPVCSRHKVAADTETRLSQASSRW